MNKLFYIAFLFCLFACKHPESKIFERYKEVTIVEETKTESNTEYNTYKVIGIKDGSGHIGLPPTLIG